MGYTAINLDTLCAEPDETLITEARHSGDALHRELAVRLERELGLHATLELQLTDALKDVASKSKSWVDTYIDEVIERLETRAKRQS